MKLSTYNLETGAGKPAENQTVVTIAEENGKTVQSVFFSYGTPIAKRNIFRNGAEEIKLSPEWDYSHTTRMYLYRFLSHIEKELIRKSAERVKRNGIPTALYPNGIKTTLEIVEGIEVKTIEGIEQ